MNKEPVKVLSLQKMIGSALDANLFECILNIGKLREAAKNIEKDNLRELLNDIESAASNYTIVKHQIEVLKNDVELLDEGTLSKIFPSHVDALIKTLLHQLTTS